MILGIRPEAFEDAALADPGLPTVDADVLVLEELGSDTHVIFPIDAPRVEAEDLAAAADDEEEACSPTVSPWTSPVYAAMEGVFLVPSRTSSRCRSSPRATPASPCRR